VSVVLITAVAVVLTARLAQIGTESRDRAAVLDAVAAIIRVTNSRG